MAATEQAFPWARLLTSSYRLLQPSSSSSSLYFTEKSLLLFQLLKHCYTAAPRCLSPPFPDAFKLTSVVGAFSDQPLTVPLLYSPRIVTIEMAKLLTRTLSAMYMARRTETRRVCPRECTEPRARGFVIAGNKSRRY